MLVRVLLVAVLLAAIIAAYYWYPIARARQASAQIEAHTTPYEQHPEHPAVRILVAGDSTGVGTGAARPDDSIAGRIGQDVPNADITNISHNGDTIAQMNARLATQDDSRYDLILYQIGANDITGRTPYDSIESGLQQALAYANARASSTIVMTAGDVGAVPIFRFPLSSFMTKRTLDVRDIFRKATAAYPNASYVDLYEDPAHNVFNTNVRKYYAADRFHPSSAGYAEWYRYLGPRIRPLFPDLGAK